jgi:hypothetical protein
MQHDSHKEAESVLGLGFVAQERDSLKDMWMSLNVKSRSLSKQYLLTAGGASRGKESGETPTDLDSLQCVTIWAGNI